MTRASTSRTFTACWTCRRRNIGCDAAQPSCSQCKRSGIACEGYHFNLVWVDSETGSYVPQQRRSYPCHLTWKNFPSLTSAEVDHLIRVCKYNEYRQYRCRLHRGPNPFTALPQGQPYAKPVDISEEDGDQGIPQSPRASHLSVADFRSLTFAPSLGRNTTSSVRDTGVSTSPTKAWDVDAASYGERKLFHHFVFCLATVIPVDDDDNPWKTTYPSLAMQTTRTSGAKALYHALLAQSAYHVANLKGAQLGAQERASAIRHYGTALHELRHSLIEPSKDYTTVLAALYTIILAEHVFQGTASGWQGHIRGARAVVYDYLEQKPWGKSQEAYIVTQNFALSVLISSTVDDKFLATERADGVNELDGLLHDLMVRPVFGYTIGGTPHMLRALYQTRLLEAQIKAKGDTDTDGPPEPDADMFGRVGEILQLSYIPLADKVDSYVTHRKHSGVTVLPRMRTLTLLHLRLFNTAIIIYLFCVVLRCPPSSMAQDVLQVLRDGTTFSEMQNGTVSVWPVFVAAAEAYTPEARALATHCLDMSLALGVANLRDILRVINQVWRDRENVARERQYDPGNVSVDWRQVMKKLNTDIFLL